MACEASTLANNSKNGRVNQPAPPPALKPSENSWVARQRSNKAEDDATVSRKMKGILNKLTLEKFEPLYTTLELVKPVGIL